MPSLRRLVPQVLGAMALLDSPAAFSLRLKELNLAEFAATFLKMGFTTHADFAFSSRWTPASTDDVPLLELAKKILGADEHPRLPALRRLLFEASTLVAADMNLRVGKTDDDAPRKMPQPERAARWASLSKRLAALITGPPGTTLITGELESSHDLINRCSAMHDDNQLKYLHWHQCTKRSSELKGEKEEKWFKEDAQGFMKAQHVGVQAGPADLSTDLLLRFALQRRGLAFDTARVMSFEVHEQLVNRLIYEMLSDVPEHCNRVTLQQIKMADTKAFELLVELTPEGIRPDQTGVLPLDTAVPLILANYRFALTLTPTTKGVASGRRRASEEESDAPPAKRQRGERGGRTGNRDKSQREMELERQVENLKAGGARNARDKAQDRSKPKGKGKGKGKDKAAPAARRPDGPNMPRELVGHSARDDSGASICFSFNLACGCTTAEAGGKCHRGRHVCCKCFGKHALPQCTA